MSSATVPLSQPRPARVSAPMSGVIPNRVEGTQSEDIGRRPNTTSPAEDSCARRAVTPDLGSYSSGVRGGGGVGVVSPVAGVGNKASRRGGRAATATTVGSETRTGALRYDKVRY